MTLWLTFPGSDWSTSGTSAIQLIGQLKIHSDRGDAYQCPCETGLLDSKRNDDDVDVNCCTENLC